MIKPWKFIILLHLGILVFYTLLAGFIKLLQLLPPPYDFIVYIELILIGACFSYYKIYNE